VIAPATGEAVSADLFKEGLSQIHQGDLWVIELFPK
jgi:hypothetical protein